MTAMMMDKQRVTQAGLVLVLLMSNPLVWDAVGTLGSATASLAVHAATAGAGVGFKTVRVLFDIVCLVAKAFGLSGTCIGMAVCTLGAKSVRDVRCARASWSSKPKTFTWPTGRWTRRFRVPLPKVRAERTGVLANWQCATLPTVVPQGDQGGREACVPGFRSFRATSDRVHRMQVDIGVFDPVTNETELFSRGWFHAFTGGAVLDDSTPVFFGTTGHTVVALRKRLAGTNGKALRFAVPCTDGPTVWFCPAEYLDKVGDQDFLLRWLWSDPGDDTVPREVVWYPKLKVSCGGESFEQESVDLAAIPLGVACTARGDELQPTKCSGRRFMSAIQGLKPVTEYSDLLSERACFQSYKGFEEGVVLFESIGPVCCDVGLADKAGITSACPFEGTHGAATFSPSSDGKGAPGSSGTLGISGSKPAVIHVGCDDPASPTCNLAIGYKWWVWCLCEKFNLERSHDPRTTMQVPSKPRFSSFIGGRRVRFPVLHPGKEMARDYRQTHGKHYERFVFEEPDDGYDTDDLEDEALDQVYGGDVQVERGGGVGRRARRRYGQPGDEASGFSRTRIDPAFVLGLLRERYRSALEISKACGCVTKADVNPTLYSMLKAGLIVKSGDYWELPSSRSQVSWADQSERPLQKDRAALRAEKSGAKRRAGKAATAEESKQVFPEKQEEQDSSSTCFFKGRESLGLFDTPEVPDQKGTSRPGKFGRTPSNLKEKARFTEKVLYKSHRGQVVNQDYSCVEPKVLSMYPRHRERFIGMVGEEAVAHLDEYIASQGLCFKRPESWGAHGLRCVGKHEFIARMSPRQVKEEKEAQEAIKAMFPHVFHADGSCKYTLPTKKPEEVSKAFDLNVGCYQQDAKGEPLGDPAPVFGGVDWSYLKKREFYDKLFDRFGSAPFGLPSDFEEFKNWGESIMPYLNWGANMGASATHFGSSTMEGIRGPRFEEALRLAYTRLLLAEYVMHFRRPQAGDADSGWFVVNGVCDPMRVMEKYEPHPERKAKLGKYRVIVHHSTVDMLVHRFVFKPLNQAELDRFPLLPSMVGVGTDKVHAMMVQAEFERMAAKGTLDSSDLSGYDVHTLGFFFHLDAVRRSRACGYKDGGLCWLLTKLAISPVYYLPSGELVCKTWEGQMPSGWMNTSATNGFTRVAHSAIAMEDPDVDAKAAGDDCVEQSDGEKVRDFMARAGQICREYTPYTLEEGVSWCSTLWKHGACYPDNEDKHVASIYWKVTTSGLSKTLDDVYAAYCELYSQHPDRDKFDELFERLFALRNARAPGSSSSSCASWDVVGESSDSPHAQDA